jgi:hypothetical protein
LFTGLGHLIFELFIVSSIIFKSISISISTSSPLHLSI